MRMEKTRSKRWAECLNRNVKRHWAVLEGISFGYPPGFFDNFKGGGGWKGCVCVRVCNVGVCV